MRSRPEAATNSTVLAGSTELFRFTSPSAPEQVWAALTREGSSTTYLFGIDLRSSWEPGAAVVSSGPACEVLSGTVLRAEQPVRLSFTLGAGEGQPVTFLTWEVRAHNEGSVVRLYVDQPDALDEVDEAEEVWLPVVERLRTLLHP